MKKSEIFTRNFSTSIVIYIVEDYKILFDYGKKDRQ